VSTLQAKAPDEVEAYKAFVLEVAEAVGKAAGGGDTAEAATIETIRSALG
jgi:tellurite resistance protein